MVGILAVHFFFFLKSASFTEKHKNKNHELESSMQGIAPPDECPDRLVISGRGH